MIRITNARTHVKDAVTLLVTISPRTEGFPIRIARRSSEVILEAIEGLTELGGKYRRCRRTRKRTERRSFSPGVQRGDFQWREAPVPDGDVIDFALPLAVARFRIL